MFTARSYTGRLVVQILSFAMWYISSMYMMFASRLAKQYNSQSL